MLHNYGRNLSEPKESPFEKRSEPGLDIIIIISSAKVRFLSLVPYFREEIQTRHEMFIVDGSHWQKPRRVQYLFKLVLTLDWKQNQEKKANVQ